MAPAAGGQHSLPQVIDRCASAYDPRIIAVLLTSSCFMAGMLQLICVTFLLTGEPVDQYCARLLKATGVLLLPATLYDHRTSIEGGHFRLGLGRRNFAECMGKWEEFIRSDH